MKGKTFVWLPSETIEIPDLPEGNHKPFVVFSRTLTPHDKPIEPKSQPDPAIPAFPAPKDQPVIPPVIKEEDLETMEPDSKTPEPPAFQSEEPEVLSALSYPEEEDAPVLRKAEYLEEDFSSEGQPAFDLLQEEENSLLPLIALEEEEETEQPFQEMEQEEVFAPLQEDETPEAAEQAVINTDERTTESLEVQEDLPVPPVSTSDLSSQPAELEPSEKPVQPAKQPKASPFAWKPASIEEIQQELEAEKQSQQSEHISRFDDLLDGEKADLQEAFLWSSGMPMPKPEPEADKPEEIPEPEKSGEEKPEAAKLDEAEPEITPEDLEASQDQRFFLRHLNSGITLRLPKEGLVIGSATDSDFVITFDPTISRRHCRIYLENGSPHIEDLHSSNGTFVSYQPLEAPVPLSREDLIRLSNTQIFQVFLDEEEEA